MAGRCDPDCGRSGDSVQILKNCRDKFVESVSESVINGLLDDMIQNKVLNQEEMEEVKKEHRTIFERARVLIDYVIRKGSCACQHFISCIRKRDEYLANILELP